LTRVDGDVRVSVREELVGVCRAASLCSKVSEILFEVLLSESR
jgi:hypothetical protein